MPRITVFDNQGEEKYNFPLNERPVFVGRGEDCDIQLPDLPAFGKQLRIEWKNQERSILATRLTPDCEVELNGQSLSHHPTVWAEGVELHIGSYKFHHDHLAEPARSTGDRFIVNVQQGHRNLALTPGRENSCLLNIQNHSAREVDCNISAMVDGRSVNWVTGAGLLTPQFTEMENRSVALHFKAPRTSAVKAGSYRAAITARSTVENYSPGSDSVSLIVERFFQHDLKIERLLRDNPIFGLMFRKARFNLKIANQGNCPDNYELQIENEADASEQAQSWFAGSSAQQTELEIESGQSRATMLFMRHPLLWLPLWKKRSFNVRSISQGARQASAEDNQWDSQRAVKFTQFSVIWLILAVALIGWLSWNAGTVWLKPEFVEEVSFKRKGGKLEDKIEAGDEVEVSWIVRRASSVDIFRVIKGKPPEEIKTGLKASDSYTTGKLESNVILQLVARNFFGEAQIDKEIPVGFQEARIIFLTPDPRRLMLDESRHALLNVEWKVEIGHKEFIKEVSIDGQKVIESNGIYSYATEIEGAKIFEVAVHYTNRDTPTSKPYRVMVDSPTPTPIPSPTPSPTPPRCDPSNQFSVIWPEKSDKAAKRPPTAIKKGDQVFLTWNVHGADSVRIMKEEEGSGRTMLQTDSQASGSVEINPQRRTNYTLILVKSGQEVECKSVSVAVKCRYGKKTPPFYEWRDCK